MRPGHAVQGHWSYATLSKLTWQLLAVDTECRTGKGDPRNWNGTTKHFQSSDTVCVTQWCLGGRQSPTLTPLKMSILQSTAQDKYVAEFGFKDTSKKSYFWKEISCAKTFENGVTLFQCVLQITLHSYHNVTKR